MTIVNTLVTAILQQLQAAPAIAPQVARVRLRPVSASTTTAVVVRPVASEVLEGEMTTGYPISWNTTIAVECYARASAQAAPDQAVDALLAAVYQRLLADPTLGGQVVVLQPLQVAYDFDADGEQTVCAVLTLSARQRTVGNQF